MNDFEIREFIAGDAPVDADEQELPGPEVMPVGEFMAAVEIGGFTVDDGVGFYSTSADIEDQTPYSCWASRLDDQDLMRMTHVVWYNK